MKRTKTRMAVSTRAMPRTRLAPPSGDGTPFEPYFKGFNILTDPEFENFRDNSGGWYYPDREGGETRYTVPYLDLDCESFLLWPDGTCVEKGKMLIGWVQTSGPYILEDPDPPPNPPPDPDPPPPDPGDITPPAVPTGLVAVAGNTQVLLNWNTNTEADFNRYRIYIATAAAGPFTLHSLSFDASQTITGLINGTQYWFKVSAIDLTLNESAQSSAVTAIPTVPNPSDTTPPPVPTGVTATPGDRQITVDWNNSPATDLDHYGVYRASAAAGPYVLVATATASLFFNPNLTNGQTYHYKISAVDQTGNESALSASASATPVAPPPPPPDTTPPAAPTGLTATAGNTQASLNWNNNVESDLSGYRVYRATSASGPFTQIISRSVSDYVATGLTNGTTYWFRVSAVDTTGNESLFSAAVSVTPVAPPVGDVTPPAVPTGLSATAGDRLVTLNWNNNVESDFAFYNVKRGNSGGPYTTIATRTASDYINSGLTNGTTYFFVVSAVDTSGNESANTSQVSATPTAPVIPPPTDPPPPGSGGDGFPTYADRALTINPGDDIDTKIQSVPVGTIIGFAAGFHDIFTSGAQFAPRNGERLVGQTDSNGVPLAIIRGNWNGTQSGTGLASPFSYTGGSAGYASNVQFLRLDVRNFAANLQQAVINGGGGWRVHKCYIHDNKTGGIRVGNGATLFGCKIYRNMQIGMITVHNNLGATIDTCEFFENNFHNWVDWHWEGGAMKFIGSTSTGQPQNMVTKNCHFHHNQGPGVWYDFAGGGGRIENNLCEHNVGPGLFYEITTGAGAIRGNTCRFNGGAAELYFSNSRGLAGNPVIVENNLTENAVGTTNKNHAGIWLSDHPTRPTRLGHVIVRGNTVRRRAISGMANMAAGTFGDSITPPSVSFQDNDYFITSGVQWQWLGTGKSWSAWQALGFDLTGSQNLL